MINVDDFEQELECKYKGRIYSVRDNGAIFRHQKEGSKLAPLDNVWTFGRKDHYKGYMMISGVPVHRIVATAFHGAHENPNMVVDHIDTNRCNNRPSNLRWITRLENVLNNPITRAKIELICGSIEAFVADPSILSRYGNEYSNFSWMRTVTPEEAKYSYNKWLEWSKRPLEERMNRGGSTGNWLYVDKKGLSVVEQYHEGKKWKIQVVDRTEYSFFPLAPLTTLDGEDIIQKYCEALIPGKEFLVSVNFTTIFKEVVFFEKENVLRVLSERVNAQRVYWYVFEIWADEDIIYHKIVGSYTKKQLKDAQIAISDLTKFHRQEWKYNK